MINCLLKHILAPNLLTIILTLLISCIIISFWLKTKKKIFSLTLTTTTFVFMLSSTTMYTVEKTQSWIKSTTRHSEIFSGYDIALNLSMDNLSMYFVILTCFIFPFCIFGSFVITKQYKEFIVYLLLLEIFLIISFTTTNLVVFYVFFESVLIPMFIIIGKWGSRERKTKAAFYLFLYTLFGSFFLLFGIFYIYVITGSVQYSIILNHNYINSETTLLWWLFFIPFAIKIPMYPTHIWLPEAHVEAPTIGSVLLASLLLKLGGYGFLRILFPIAGENTLMLPVAYSTAIAGVVFASLSTIRQIDLKKIIAYSSVAHMNLIVLGLFSNNVNGIYGAIYLMIAHAFVSSGLFLCIGVLYDRYHTRLIRYYGGLSQTMPVFSIFFFFFTLANISFPGTANFIGEFLILTGIGQSQLTSTNSILLPAAASGIVLSSIYAIWVYNKTMFGTLKTKYISCFTDITRSEFLLLIFLIIVTIIFGVTTRFVYITIC